MMNTRSVTLLPVRTRLLQVAVLVGVAAYANGQKSSPPDVPDKIKAPAGEELALQAHATGAQIYVCQQGPDEKYSWALKAPEAELHDQQGAIIGRHSAGPTWKHNDGSEIGRHKSARRSRAPARPVLRRREI